MFGQLAQLSPGKAGAPGVEEPGVCLFLIFFMIALALWSGNKFTSAINRYQLILKLKINK